METATSPRFVRSAVLQAVVLMAATIMLAAPLLIGCAPRQVPPGPKTGAAVLEPTRVVAPDGAVLPLRRWLPEGDPRAVLLALHGFNDYSRAFELPAKTLVKADIAIYAYDQRGFGEAPNRGLWAGVDGMTADLRMVAGLIREKHKNTPFYILGESMGAAVILASMNQDQPPPEADGYILSAPAVWGRDVMPGWQRIGLTFIAHTVPSMTFTGRGLGRVPSDNIEMLRRLGRDPLVIKETRVDAIWGLVNLMDAALEATPHVADRTLILFGGREDIVPSDAVRTMMARLPKNRCVRVMHYSSGYHMLLRDLNAEIVLADIAAWTEFPDRTLPSSAPTLVASASVTATPASTATVVPGRPEPVTSGRPAQGSGAKRAVPIDCGSPIAARP